MKHKNKIRILFLLVVLVIYAGCTDYPIYRDDSSSEIPDGPLKDMKDYFENNASMLRQVHFGNASDDNTRTVDPSHTCDPSCDHDLSGSANLLPSWDKARLWEGEKNLYAEVPLKGQGVYKAAFLSSVKGCKVYPVRSYLLLVQDKGSGSIHYTIVTAMSQSQLYSTHPSEQTLEFLGNRHFQGLLFFSDLDGTCYRTLHLLKGKSHPVFIGSRNASARSSTAVSDSLLTFGISLASSSRFYNDGELDTDGNIICGYCKKKYKPGLTLACSECGTTPGNMVLCGFCKSVYDLDKGCPKGCGVEIPGGGGVGGGGSGVIFVECIFCRRSYDSVLGGCPYGCDRFCPSCHKNPCECYHYECELCGSASCPGPWYCGGSENDCTGELCLVCGGYKNNTRSSSDCPVCICSDYSVILGVIPRTVDLGDDYTMTIVRASSRVTITNVEYNIMFQDNNTPLPLGEGVGLRKTVRAYRAGVWNLQATVHFSDGKKVETESQPLTVLNPLYSKIMSDPMVVSKMNTLWAEAVDKAKTEYSYKEKGCWILFNTTNNQYEFMNVKDSPELNCNGITPIDFPRPTLQSKYPNVGNTYIVGTFHTHPARTGCGPGEYPVGPSDIDKKMDTVCLLYDYVGNSKVVEGGHSPTDAHKLYHCALERHPLD